jgi:stage II sporulation protein D
MAARGAGCFAAVAATLLFASGAAAQAVVQFGVLGLFHPRELILEQDGLAVISVHGVGSPILLNGESGHRRLFLRADGERVVANGRSASAWKAGAREDAPATFRLSIAGKIHRTFHGQLTILARRGELLAIVAIDREQAVASILAGEMANAPLEALKAQAVVTRSFLAAGSRHRDYDFCDTTHCQFLRGPDDVGPRVTNAVNSTRDLILSYGQKPLAAMYSQRCRGRTHSLREVGLESGHGYPYYALPCKWCRKDPIEWRRRVTPDSTPPRPGSEPARIAHDREWGWSALPGSDFTLEDDAAGVFIKGHSLGHGVGMCQIGAAGMAKAGAHFRAILAYYYPNTELVALR